ncbi:DNA topoisomerase III [Ferrimonas aestuarii]|uniref:DNA topoisomerase n=1 Tax=Ferrimonas aestuarii TaxID=2569539 RepID=A0A4V5NWI8_9GAMM|nr:DNA topoisomerase III [Ferrimonas aestuarii]TKB58278.1 DNA topoisomerase III [Ferrimonas aestuarii]
MKLYIAEKPSLGRAIAAVLPKPHKKQEGYIELGNGDCVSWCVGHLLEQAEPGDYNDSWQQWREESLPMVPEQWRLKTRKGCHKQLMVLKKLIGQSQQLVHAGDPDREGQLLVDEVIHHLKVPKTKQQAMQRLLVSDLTPAAVTKALSALRPNSEFSSLSVSALARSRADWLYGLNMTRAYTLQGRKVNYSGVLSVGRVQTPLLGLVVRRDKAIEQFQSKAFFEVLAHLQTQDKEPFSAKWCPSEACQPYMDEEGRVLVRKLAETVVRRIDNQPGKVTKVDRKRKSQGAPLPYNLSSLQIDAAKRFGFSAQQVLDIAQSLYERHNLITYPRSDSRHLPKQQHGDAPQVGAAIGNHCSELSQGVTNADFSRRNRAWNDSKVEAHHAIIPTSKGGSAKLSADEAKLYQQIARQYLLQFYSDYRFDETKVEVEVAGGKFAAQSKVPVDLGWKQLMPQKKQPDSASTSNKPGEAAEEQSREHQTQLPHLEVGQSLHCLGGEILDKQTQPPKHFTDATLLAAMTNIASHVSDPKIKAILKETDGLGTEATRAGIIELLFKRGFLIRQGKQIRASDSGRGLIDSLPEIATTPDMTASWESNLEAMVARQFSYQQFMGQLEQTLSQLVIEAKGHIPESLRGVKAPTKRKFKGGAKRKGRSKTSAGTKAGGKGKS